MYKTFTEWKNGNWLEDGEPRKEAYTKDELLLVEMGWKYGFDAGKAQQADRIAELEKDLALKTRDRDVFRDFTLAYEKRIEELEKLEQDFIRVIKQTNPNKPQTKPLSDEEIHELANQHLRTQDHDGAKVVTGLEDFARAIEERHGIK